MTGASSMHEAGHSKLGALGQPSGEGGREGGGGVQDGRTRVHPWLIHVCVWQKPTQYCNYPPIKIN